MPGAIGTSSSRVEDLYAVLSLGNQRKLIKGGCSVLV
jgi:hypothetical protein